MKLIILLSFGFLSLTHSFSEIKIPLNQYNSTAAMFVSMDDSIVSIVKRIIESPVLGIMLLTIQTVFFRIIALFIVSFIIFNFLIFTFKHDESKIGFLFNSIYSKLFLACFYTSLVYFLLYNMFQLFEHKKYYENLKTLAEPEIESFKKNVEQKMKSLQRNSDQFEAMNLKNVFKNEGIARRILQIFQKKKHQTVLIQVERQIIKWEHFCTILNLAKNNCPTPIFSEDIFSTSESESRNPKNPFKEYHQFLDCEKSAPICSSFHLKNLREDIERVKNILNQYKNYVYSPFLKEEKYQTFESKYTFSSYTLHAYFYILEKVISIPSFFLNNSYFIFLSFCFAVVVIGSFVFLLTLICHELIKKSVAYDYILIFLRIFSNFFLFLSSVFLLFSVLYAFFAFFNNTIYFNTFNNLNFVEMINGFSFKERSVDYNDDYNALNFKTGIFIKVCKMNIKIRNNWNSPGMIDGYNEYFPRRSSLQENKNIRNIREVVRLESNIVNHLKLLLDSFPFNDGPDYLIKDSGTQNQNETYNEIIEEIEGEFHYAHGSFFTELATKKKFLKTRKEQDNLNEFIRKIPKCNEIIGYIEDIKNMKFWKIFLSGINHLNTTSLLFFIGFYIISIMFLLLTLILRNGRKQFYENRNDFYRKNPIDRALYWYNM